MKQLLDIRIAEEMNRLDGIPGIMPSEFTFFTAIRDNQNIRKAYKIMQNQYVLRNCDRIDFAKVLITLTDIEKKLTTNLTWNSYQL